MVAVGQLLAGVGNLAFIAIAARMFPAGAFGDLAAFVALLTALHLPGAGLAAAGALAGGGAARMVRSTTRAGIVASVGLAVLAVPLSALIGLPPPYVLALAAAAPVAPLLGLRRGQAYGASDHRSVVQSLLAEPAARLVLGLGVGLVAGAPGAAWGAAAGGWLALLALRGVDGGGRGAAPRPGTVGATALTFVAFAILQHQDLVLANRLLGEVDAGAFAALSTIGGLAAFATATLPLVLLPRAARGDGEGFRVALGAALVVAAASLAVGVLAARPLVDLVVGSDYARIAPLVPWYLAAMSGLGLARVVAAQRCAHGYGERVARVAVTALVLHAMGLVLFARTPGQVVALSGAALAGVVTVLAIPSGWDAAALPQPWYRRVPELLRRPDGHLLLALTIAAVAVRLMTERSFWVDEAITVRQAQMPLGAMLENLRATDVHPPLHFFVQWVDVRAFGTAEWAVRLPSVVCGAALVPVLYGTARELFDRRTGQVAAVLAVTAPFLVWYSQEARMYALFMLIGVAGVWAQVAALRRGTWSAFLAWGTLSALLLWTQWFALLPLAVQQLVTIMHLWRRWRAGERPRLALRWVGSIGLTVVLLLPLVPFVMDQLAAYGERGKGLAMPSAAGAENSSVAGGLSSYSLIANLLWALGGYHSDDVMLRLGAMWPLAMLGSLLLLGRRLQWTSATILAVALVPAGALFAIGHMKRDLFELRYFILAAPLLLILVARAATSLALSRRGLAVLVSLLAVLSTVALVDQQLNGSNPRLYDFRGAMAKIEETAQPGDTIAYAPAYLEGVLAYYEPDLEGMPLGSVEPEEVDGPLYVVVAERFLTPTSSGTVGDLLVALENERGAPARIDRPNVIVWRFS
jgi:O-antigen/teichoic acid export membrane protein